MVDLFVEEIDLEETGFQRTAPARTGRPGYHPSVLLKLFIYGYLNRVPSSRALEREAGRNVEVMWLTGRLAPDHKTIADFRRDNGPAIRRTCAQFVELCRRIGVLKGDCVAIDGSKFKADNNRDKNFTKGKIKSRTAHLVASIQRYLDEMVRIDRQEEGEARVEKIANLAQRCERIRQEIARLVDMGEALRPSPDSQISLTDPDARSMATSAKGSGFVGYNAQSAVDTETHLIVTHDVINVGHDREQLSPMAKSAKAALGRGEMSAVADKGYFSGREILACHQDGITTTLPRPETSGNRKKGRYVKANFAYDAGEDVYLCPAGETLTYRYTTEESGLSVRRYWTNACLSCPAKARCTTGRERRISRWEHEHLVDQMCDRLSRDPALMGLRRSTVEHPFGTIKAWMGATHFRMRTLKNVRTEMAFHVLAYNIKRMIALIGVRGLLTAIPT
ncbi:transposase, IS4 family protein [Rhodobacteraceae bacterium KLH11]|nr:transposase, IS4 family protein [Rhodobacteraceae bacterium KLH11]